MYYGWRAKIGLILPATNTATERDFYMYAPEGVIALGQHIEFKAVTVDGLLKMGEHVMDAAKMLAFAGCDLLVYGCTTGSMVGGIGYDTNLIEEVKRETGVPMITTSVAVIDGLKTLGSKKICLTTPYPDEVNQMEKKFLEDSGFEVVALKGIPCKDPVDAVTAISYYTYDKLHKATKEVFTPEADTVFMSCTGLGIMDYIDIAEKSFDRPVIASNYATVWKALKTLGIKYDGPYIGKLFTL
ncbi:MAG: aspartate/glutamate racemase family protein [Lachnospiraceae bacterium]|nr:aspartate/glutamate racemase family protein [Lachnospiraceae bacterium]